MPTYTFEVDGQKYSVISDKQPTKEELLALVEKQKTLALEIPEETTQQQEISTDDNKIVLEETEQLTEETIKKDPKWISASKEIYEWDWKRKKSR